MQLRRFLTGLTAMAVVALVSTHAGATSRVFAPGIDFVTGGIGVNGLICVGKVVGKSDPIAVTFPNSTRTLPAIEYTIDCSKILKGNSIYPATSAPTTIKIKMFAGELKDFPTPVVGRVGMHFFFGNSVVGLTSYAFGNQGYYDYQEVDGQMVAIGSSKGLAFKSEKIKGKFMQSVPNAGKFLRRGPATPGVDTPETASEANVTPEALEKAVTLSLQGEQ